MMEDNSKKIIDIYYLFVGFKAAFEARAWYPRKTCMAMQTDTK